MVKHVSFGSNVQCFEAQRVGRRFRFGESDKVFASKSDGLREIFTDAKLTALKFGAVTKDRFLSFEVVKFYYKWPSTAF